MAEGHHEGGFSVDLAVKWYALAGRRPARAGFWFFWTSFAGPGQLKLAEGQSSR